MQNQNEPTAVAVPGELCNRVLTYLAQRPFIEVAAMIAEFQQCQPIPGNGGGPIVDGQPMPPAEPVYTG